MKYKKAGKILKLNDKEIEFPNEICKVLEFNGVYIVFIMDKNIFPIHNIIAVNADGSILWRIEDVIKLGSPDPYVDLYKENDRHVWVRSASGVETTFDVYTKEIIDQEVRR